jgi:predicted RNA binding protein YcfA (HicA-like mRNA interferase family)
VPRRYPPLTLAEVKAILTCWGFVAQSRKRGSHCQWERRESERVFAVTVDEGINEFDDFLIKTMIQQSGLTRDQFYSGCKSAAKKANLKPHRNAR